jgi:hypothetical protein
MASQVDLSSIVSREFPAVVFVNPAAGGGRTADYLPRIRKIFEAHALPTEFVLTKSAVELEAWARESIASRRRAPAGDGRGRNFSGLGERRDRP